MPPGPHPTREELLDALARNCWLAYEDGEEAFLRERFAVGVLCAIRSLEQTSAWGFESLRRPDPGEPPRIHRLDRHARRVARALDRSLPSPVVDLVHGNADGPRLPQLPPGDPFEDAQRRADWFRARLGGDHELVLKARQLVAMERSSMNYDWAVQMPNVRLRAEYVTYPLVDVGDLPIPAWPQDFAWRDARPWLDIAHHVASKIGVPRP